ncbi:hypothetical protein COB21_00250 [Candidatus Aerophobetes bacterium]|uniref:Uncharacterized protein n=1 Tax=Aerophobetes bacterium TaxID=2030807 RepID=A0A2A4X816_UNCAE|nr:MAG: hypothetical protein COB21_00250 [Candidatus Aerophobetes bacterium]
MSAHPLSSSKRACQNAPASSAPITQVDPHFQAAVDKLNAVVGPSLKIIAQDNKQLTFHFAPTPEQRLQQGPGYTHRMAISDIIKEIDILKQDRSTDLQEQLKKASSYSPQTKLYHLFKVAKEKAKLYHTINITNLSILESRTNALTDRFIDNKRRYNERLNMAKEEYATRESTPTTASVRAKNNFKNLQIWWKQLELERVLNLWLSPMETFLNLLQRQQNLLKSRQALHGESRADTPQLQQIETNLVETQVKIAQFYGRFCTPLAAQQTFNNVDSLKIKLPGLEHSLTKRNRTRWLERIQDVLVLKKNLQKATDFTPTQLK